MIFSKPLRKYITKYWLNFVLGIIFLIIADVAQIYIPGLVGEAIDILENRATIPDFEQLIYNALGMMALLVTLTICARILWRYFLIITSRKIERNLKSDMFIHATKLPQSFYSQKKVGALMALFINDIEAYRMFFAFGIVTLIDGIVLVALIGFKMSEIHYTIFLFCFVPILILGLMMIIVRKNMARRYRLVQESYEGLSDYVQETFSGAPVIRAYTRENFENQKFSRIAKNFQDKTVSHLRLATFINTGINFLLSLTLVVGIWTCGNLIVNGVITSGDLVNFIMLYGQLMWPIMAISQFIQIYTRASVSSKRIYDYMVAKEQYEREDAINIDEFKGNIEFKNLNFAYPDNSSKKVLENISFTIKQGEYVGILGHTGSGKTTITDLLLKIYDVDNGQLFYDGNDINKITLKSIRENVSFVPQDNFLFSDTIKNNINFSAIAKGDETIISAAKNADVYNNIIEFNDGFETVLGERGVTISGGQKQRISIARALLKNPKILILDDAVSAVDTRTETEILANLFRIRKDKTTIMIAHRVSTVKQMDKIILLDHGHIIGIGNHEQLLATSPVYQDMVHRQSLEDMINETKIGQEE